MCMWVMKISGFDLKGVKLSDSLTVNTPQLLVWNTCRATKFLEEQTCHESIGISYMKHI